MAEKIIDFGMVGPAGNTFEWRGILDDDTLGAGDAIDFHVELTRPAADGALGAPGLSIFVLQIPFTADLSLDPPGALLATDTGNQFAAGETRSPDFHITNGPGGATPASYALLSVIAWDDGGGVEVGVSPLFVVP